MGEREERTRSGIEREGVRLTGHNRTRFAGPVRRVENAEERVCVERFTNRQQRVVDTLERERDFNRAVLICIAHVSDA